MNFLEKLNITADKFRSLVCLGLDPVLEDIPLEGSPKDKIVHFYEEILNKILQEKVYPAAVKPNYAFYAQYGFEGLEALCQVINLYQAEGLPVILDVKRGDIGKTAKAYAKEAFDFFKADAVTLSPFLGYDSLAPFIENYPDKGYYLLIKTSNTSSGEIQDILYEENPFYLYLAKKLVTWHQAGLGAVVGATYPEQFKEIANLFFSSRKEIPFLVPGIGSQGGDLAETVKTIVNFGNFKIHRINSSSAINYAYKKESNLSFAEAAVKALNNLNSEIQGLVDNFLGKTN